MPDGSTGAAHRKTSVEGNAVCVMGVLGADEDLSEFSLVSMARRVEEMSDGGFICAGCDFGFTFGAHKLFTGKFDYGMI